MKQTGRPPNAVKELCREFVFNDKLIERLSKLARSAQRETDQIRAIEVLLDRGFGKSEQAIDLTTHETGRPATEVLINTLTALRAELDAARARTGVETGK